MKANRRFSASLALNYNHINFNHTCIEQIMPSVTPICFYEAVHKPVFSPTCTCHTALVLVPSCDRSQSVRVINFCPACIPKEFSSRPHFSFRATLSQLLVVNLSRKLCSPISQPPFPHFLDAPFPILPWLLSSSIPWSSGYPCTRYNPRRSRSNPVFPPPSRAPFSRLPQPACPVAT